jgi:uracil-DNA glycosylase family 4
MSLESIARQVLICLKCDLCKNRTNAVPGEGSGKARIVLVGEAPGREEDIQGRPFVGRAGRLLDTVLSKAELKRNECFITNVVKCRPPANSKPLKREMKACYPYLKRQIVIIDPEVIVCLGNIAADDFFTQKDMPQRGFLTTHEDRTYLLTIHPAACLRNPEYLPLLEIHLQRVAKYIKAKPQKASKGLERYI